MNNYLNPSSSVIIDNCVVSKYLQSGVSVTPIRMLKKHKADLSCLSELPRIYLGNRILDNKLLSRITNIDIEPITVEGLIEQYQPTQYGLDTILFPNLIIKNKKIKL
jgi:hypothetical protein